MYYDSYLLYSSGILHKQRKRACEWNPNETTCKLYAQCAHSPIKYILWQLSQSFCGRQIVLVGTFAFIRIRNACFWLRCTADVGGDRRCRKVRATYWIRICICANSEKEKKNVFFVSIDQLLNVSIFHLADNDWINQFQKLNKI